MLRFLKRLLHTAAFLSLLGLGVALWAGWAGIPKGLVRRVLPMALLESSGRLTVDWDRLRWAPWLGVTVDDVRVTISPPSGGPDTVLSVSRMRVHARNSRRHSDARIWQIILSGVRLNTVSPDLGEAGTFFASAWVIPDEERVRLDNVMVASMGGKSSARERDFLRGSAEYHPGSGRLDGEVFLRVDPERYRPAYGPRVPEGVRSLEFDHPVQVSAGFGLDVSDPATLVSEGRVQTGSFRCRGEPVAALDAAYVYEDGRWLLNRVNLLRHDGFLRGWIDLDTIMETVSLDLDNTVPPDALARMIAPGLAARMSRFSLAAPVSLAVSGFAGYGERREMELNVDLRSAEAGYREYAARNFSMEANLTELGVDVYDFHAEVGGGKVSGDGVYEFPRPPWRPWFELDAGARDVQLADLADRYTRVENPYDYEGRIVGRLVLAGPLDSRDGREMAGHGFLDIGEGYLLTLPLLGGLSRYLSAIYPRIGYAEQRNFECTFDIRDGAVRSEDILLAGDMLAIDGHGNYYFDQRVKFRVVVKFFQEGGLLERIARFVTAPISKALEFELTGTIDNPHWAPLNTPKRLMRFFRRTLGLDT